MANFPGSPTYNLINLAAALTCPLLMTSMKPLVKISGLSFCLFTDCAGLGNSRAKLSLTWVKPIQGNSQHNMGRRYFITHNCIGQWNQNRYQYHFEKWYGFRS